MRDKILPKKDALLQLLIRGSPISAGNQFCADSLSLEPNCLGPLCVTMAPPRATSKQEQVCRGCSCDCGFDEHGSSCRERDAGSWIVKMLCILFGWFYFIVAQAHPAGPAVSCRISLSWWDSGALSGWPWATGWAKRVEIVPASSHRQ